MMGEQRLVCRHHRFAGVQRCFAQLQRDAVFAADQLDHEIDLGIVRQSERIVVPADLAQVDTAVTLPISG